MSDERNEVVYHEGRWINPPDRDVYVWVPQGDYPPYENMVEYAKENFSDRVVEIKYRAFRKLVKFLQDEGIVEKEIVNMDTGMEDMAHRHLDIIEKMVGQDG